MKTAHVLIILSLAGNIGLGVVFWRRGAASRAETRPLSEAALVPKADPKAIERELSALLRADPEFTAALRSEDARRMKAALERTGFPPNYVRDILQFHFGNTVSPDHLAVLREQAQRPFWQLKPAPESVALQKTLQEKGARDNQLIADAYGGKIPPHPLQAMNQQWRYRFLPSDKIDTVARIDLDYNEIAFASRGNSPESVEKARLLQQEKRADLAKVLNAEELELYDLYLSSAAQMLRSNIGTFAVTEAEFRALLKIQQPISDKYAFVTRTADPAAVQQRATDMKMASDQTRALLGEQRYAEYERAQNYGYRAALEIATHFKLPTENAIQAYNVQQAALKLIEQLSRLPDRAAAAAQATALVSDSTAKLTGLLGAEGFNAYKKSVGGFWLQAPQRLLINRPPTTAAKPPGSG